MVAPRFDFNDDHFIQAGFELIFGSSSIFSDATFCFSTISFRCHDRIIRWQRWYFTIQGRFTIGRPECTTVHAVHQGTIEQIYRTDIKTIVNLKNPKNLT